jgi:hypothetical protein
MAESSAGRKNRQWAVAVLALLCTAAATGQARAQATAAKSYGKWWTTCDNGGACATYGTGGGAGVALTLILRRGPEPTAPVRAMLVADMPRATAPVVWRVSVDGRAAGSVRAYASQDQVMQGEFGPAEAQALVARLVAGQELRADGLAGLSLTGVKDALERMDEAQDRVGTVSALVSKGRRPANSVPPAPALPRVTATPSRIVARRDPPSGAKGDLRACRRAFKTRSDHAMRAFEMDGGQILWIIPCGRLGEVDYDLVLVSRANGDKVRPALLSDLAPPKLPRGARSNVRFDPTAGLLSEVASERSLPDCGRASTWVWNDGKFIRAREREMPECVGLPLDLWPDTFRSVVRR